MDEKDFAKKLDNLMGNMTNDEKKQFSHAIEDMLPFMAMISGEYIIKVINICKCIGEELENVSKELVNIKDKEKRQEKSKVLFSILDNFYKIIKDYKNDYMKED